MKYPKLSICLTLLYLLPKSSFGKDLGVSRLRADLERLDTQLNAIDLKTDRDSPGAVQRRIEILIKSAEQTFADKEYLSTVRIYNEILSKTTQLDIETYLRAQYLLGRSYEQLSAYPKAIKAYLRYISSFTSQKNEHYKTLIEVIRRTLLLQEKSNDTMRLSLQRLLANLMSLPLPKATQQEIALLSSIAAYHAQRYELAIPWLENLNQEETSSKIRAEAAFYEGLTYLAMGNDTKAESAFLRIMSLSEPALGITKDMAALNLARLYAAKDLPQHAWDWYQKVEGPGTSLRLAAYEAAVLLMQIQEYEKSLSIAQAYIRHYPNTQEAYRLQEWMNYLELRSGRLDTAEHKLQNRDQSLQELQKSLVNEYSGKANIDAIDLDHIRNKTEPMAMQSPIIEQGQSLFQKLEWNDQKILAIGQQMRSLTYTLGRVIDPRLRPEVQAANQQFRNIMTQLFAIGEHLLDEEQKLQANKLSEAKSNSLKRSKSRREKIYKIDTFTNKSMWKTWDELFTLQLRTSTTMDRLDKQRLKLQPVIWQGYKPQALPIEQERAKQAEDLANQLYATQEQGSQIMENLRIQVLELSKNPSELRKTRKLLLLASQEFLDSSHILEAYRDEASHPLEKEEQQEFALAWQTWQSIASHILKAIKEDESTQAEWLSQQIKEINAIKAEQNKLVSKNEQIRNQLKLVTARALPAALDNFQFHIRQQQSRANKWLADLQWQRFVIQTEEKMKLKAKSEKEESDVQEGLRDLEIERTLHE